MRRRAKALAYRVLRRGDMDDGAPMDAEPEFSSDADSETEETTDIEFLVQSLIVP